MQKKWKKKNVIFIASITTLKKKHLLMTCSDFFFFFYSQQWNISENIELITPQPWGLSPNPRDYPPTLKIWDPYLLELNDAKQFSVYLTERFVQCYCNITTIRAVRWERNWTEIMRLCVSCPKKTVSAAGRGEGGGCPLKLTILEPVRLDSSIVNKRVKD